MRRTLVLAVALAAGTMFVSRPAYSQWAVHDAALDILNGTAVANYITAIDTFYKNVDMVINTVKQIENQYRQIEMAVEKAKNIDWDNIKFDGDFDIRNDIRDANRRVNRYLTQARRIKESLDTSIIKTPEGNYSWADLLGVGDENKNFATAVDDIYGYMSGNMQSAADAAVGNLTPQQRTAIMAKYGISPKNYYFVQQSVRQVKEKASYAIAKTLDEARQLQREEKIKETNMILQAAYASRDKEGSIKEGALGEAQMNLTAKLIESVMLLQESVDELSALTAQNMMDRIALDEANANERYRQQNLQKYMQKSAPRYFSTKSESLR